MDKINSIQVVFFHPSTNGEDVRVKDDVMWIKAQFFHKQMIGPGTHFDFGVCFCRLEKGAKDCNLKYKNKVLPRKTKAHFTCQKHLSTNAWIS